MILTTKYSKKNIQPPIQISARGEGSDGGESGGGGGSGGVGEGFGGRVQRTEGVENILSVGVIKLMAGYLPPLLL